MSELATIFDTAPAENFENVEKPIDKRRALKEALRKGKGHLLPKKCTEGFAEKAPEEAIDKVHTEYLQRELQEKGEKTARALSTHVISLYASMIGNIVDIDSVDELRRDIEEDPIIRDSMTNLGILVYFAIVRCLAPILVAGHTARHMGKMKQEEEETKEEPRTAVL